MALVALLHPMDGEQRDLVLGAQGGHNRGALAHTRIVHYRDIAGVDLSVDSELERVNAGDDLRPVRSGSGLAFRRVHLVFKVVAQGGRVVKVQVPVDAVHTDMGGEGARLGRGQPVARKFFTLNGRRQSAGDGAHKTAVGVEDLQLDGTAGLVAEVIVDDCAIRGIWRMGYFD